MCQSNLRWQDELIEELVVSCTRGAETVVNPYRVSAGIDLDAALPLPLDRLDPPELHCDV